MYIHVYMYNRLALNYLVLLFQVLLGAWLDFHRYYSGLSVIAVERQLSSLTKSLALEVAGDGVIALLQNAANMS
jgi:hypothetical protein